MRSGVSKARRPGPGAKTRPAESAHQARKDAHIPVGAGEAEDLVGYSDADISFIRGFQAAGAGCQPHIRAAGILVPVETQGEAPGRAGSGARRLWNALSSRISDLRRLLARASGAGSRRLPQEDDETHGDMAVRAGTNVRRELQTTRTGSRGTYGQVPAPAGDASNRRAGTPIGKQMFL